MINDTANHVYQSFFYAYIKKTLGKTEEGNQQWTIQRNWQHWVHKTPDEDKQNKKHNTIYVGHHYAQINTTNVNKA